jgi:SHS2 domain-containing protein
MDISGVGTTADVALTAPGPTDRAPSEAARNAAANTTNTTTTKDEERKDTSATARRAESERERRAEQKRAEEQARRAAEEGLELADMFTILGMRPVSPEEAAQRERTKAQTEAITGKNGSFDLYA